MVWFCMVCQQRFGRGYGEAESEQSVTREEVMESEVEEVMESVSQ